MPTALNKHQQQSEDTRQAILDTAYRLYMDQGVERTTIQQIARESGTHRTNIYRYFHSREEIGFAIVEQLSRKFKDAYRSELAERMVGETAWDKLSALIHTGNRVGQEWMETLRFFALFDAYVSLLPHQSELGERLYEIWETHEQINLIKGLILEGAEDGSIRTDVDPELAAIGFRNAMVSGLFRIIRRYQIYQVQHGLEKPERIADTTFDIMLAGIRACPAS